jgi:hypothetical protein
MDIKQSQKVLKHLPHIEELIFLYGNDGIIFIDNLFDKLLKKSKDISIKIKIDGAPSLICGYNKDKFFVATKSLFNKKPKFNYTPEDIKVNHPDSVELQNKLFSALKNLSEVIPNNGIFYQGDLLFTEGDLKTETIEGIEYTTFKPNIITYACKKGSLNNFKLGIVFHTSYSGGLNNLQANYDPDLSVIKNSEEVWVIDNNLPLIQIDPISKKNIAEFKIMAERFNVDLSKYDKLTASICQFLNSRIKSGAIPNETKMNFYNELIKFGEDQKNFDKELVLNNKEELLNVFKLYSKIVFVKHLLIDDMEKSISENFMKTFTEGKKSEHEGFVVITPEGVVKFVDRSEFSFNNFNLPKDWE